MDPREDYCPNIIFNQSQSYSRWANYTLPLAGPRDQELIYYQQAQGKRGHGHGTGLVVEDNLYTVRNPVLDSLGEETSSLFKEAFFSNPGSSPRKKSKLSERLVEKLR